MSARTAATPTPTWFPKFKPIAPLFAAVFGLLMLAGIAIAQDPPGRIGRLSDDGGDIFLSTDNSAAGWQPVGINYPITMGDNVFVSRDGRAEIDFGGGQLRLAQEANVHFSQLDERGFAAFLANGRASLHLRVLDQGEIAKLDTPNAQIDLLRIGRYRLDTTSDGNYTMLAVREGEAEVQVGERRVIVLAGQTATVQGNGFASGLIVRDGVGSDGFDQYAMERDRRIDSAGLSARYVSSYVPGVADLNAYGTWTREPTYGAVWYPTSVSRDWVPYQDGSWTFVQPWGWTWVDRAPWGWVPFHYGRWVRIGPRWAWTPGEYTHRPVYAPALVAWYGGASGTSWSVNAGRPTYGWVPLAWGEPYWPQYRHSTEYWRLQNQYVNVDVRRVPSRPPQRYDYVNARIPGAVMAAPADVLINRRSVYDNRFNISQQQIAAAPPTYAPLTVRPGMQSNLIDKQPERAPEPAGAFAGRVRPDLRAPNSNPGGRGMDQTPSRPGMGSNMGQVAPTPAMPLPQQPVQAGPQPGAAPPSFQPAPGRPGMAQPPGLQVAPGSAQPLPGSTPSIGGRPNANDRGDAGRGSMPTAPSTTGGMAGRVYLPNERQQPGGQQGVPVPPAQVQPVQPPTPQLRPAAPAAMPQPAPVAPVQMAPPQSMPAPQQRVMPLQRGPAPMPMPVAPAPPPASIAPGPGPMAPAPGSIAAPPQRVVPQQQPARRPGEALPVEPPPATR